MENRRIMPPLFKGYPNDLAAKRKQEHDHTDPMYNEKNAEGDRMKADDKRDEAKEGKMERSYTIDEITTAQLLKGHPNAQAILDELNKSKKKNESGDVFQDGSEDTIGPDGHASVARPATVHDGDKGGDHPGTATEKEAQQKSVGDSDIEKSEDDDDEDDVEKSDNFTDNEPEEFEDGLVGAEGETDDGGVLVSKKSFSADEATLNHLIKTMGSERIEDIFKAMINPKYTKPGALASKNNPPKGDNPLTNRKVNTEALKALKNKLGTGAAEKSEGDADLEKGEGGQKEERAEWAKDKKKEEEEHMKDKSWSMDFSKSILENMGLEKGSPSVSKKVAGGKATQISYGTKPETRFKHPKQKTGETRYEHNIKEGTVTKKEATGEKGKFKEGKPIDVSDEKKLKNASEGGFDLHKALDAILEKKTRS